MNSEIRRIGKSIDAMKADPIKRRLQLFTEYRVETVFDVGANTGQYGAGLRRGGFAGRLVSFEPASAPFRVLAKKAARDGKWQAVQLALGDKNRTARLHVSGDDRASSLMKMLPAHVQVADYFAQVGVEEVAVRRLDEVYADYAAAKERVFLKVDAQGYDRHILRGAGAVLERLVGLQLELSLVALYEGETPIARMLDWLAKRGFKLASLEYGFCDPRTGRMLQCDGIFFRDHPTPAAPAAPAVPAAPAARRQRSLRSA